MPFDPAKDIISFEELDFNDKEIRNIVKLIQKEFNADFKRVRPVFDAMESNGVPANPWAIFAHYLQTNDSLKTFSENLARRIGEQVRRNNGKLLHKEMSAEINEQLTMLAPAILISFAVHMLDEAMKEEYLDSIAHQAAKTGDNGGGYGPN